MQKSLCRDEHKLGYEKLVSGGMCDLPMIYIVKRGKALWEIKK